MSTPAAPKSRYSLGSAKNLVYSLLAVLGMVLVLFFLVPRVESVTGPPVDVAGTARIVQEQTRWPIVVSEGLPSGWRATSARYVSLNGAMTWHVGYQTPSGTYLAVEQTKDPDQTWVSGQTGDAPRTGTMEVSGLTWQKYERDGATQNTLLTVPAAGSGALATVVTGSASFADMATFIGSLRPFEG